MKTAILAGGIGSRLGIETERKPKPLVEIGGRPILWHIMRHFHCHGFSDFVIALGYKGEVIKKYMADFAMLHGNLKINLNSSEIHRYGKQPMDWNVELIETGQRTQTGGRIKRLRDYLGDQTFMLTWGDGVSDVDIGNLLAFHRSHGKLATVTAVRPQARFGHIEFEGDRVVEFSEKPQTSEGWINGAYFVLEPGIFDYIEDDSCHWEKAPMENLARDGQLMAYRHHGFWQCMDTPRDLALLNRLWREGRAPWKTW
ncbi:MAG: glucose-1-phosphate cytidylyltransferase [Lysobacterales bacterium]